MVFWQFQSNSRSISSRFSVSVAAQLQLMLGAASSAFHRSRLAQAYALGLSTVVIASVACSSMDSGDQLTHVSAKDEPETVYRMSDDESETTQMLEKMMFTSDPVVSNSELFIVAPSGKSYSPTGLPHVNAPTDVFAPDDAALSTEATASQVREYEPDHFYVARDEKMSDEEAKARIVSAMSAVAGQMSTNPVPTPSGVSAPTPRPETAVVPGSTPRPEPTVVSPALSSTRTPPQIASPTTAPPTTDSAEPVTEPVPRGLEATAVSENAPDETPEPTTPTPIVVGPAAEEEPEAVEEIVDDAGESKASTEDQESTPAPEEAPGPEQVGSDGEVKDKPGRGTKNEGSDPSDENSRGGHDQDRNKNEDADEVL